MVIATPFDLRRTNQMLQDLQHPEITIYWADFLATMAVAFAAFAVFQTATDWTWIQAASFLVSGISLFRAVAFIHEIAHRPERNFRSFVIVWNLLCGIPLMMPSFLYGDHRSHHSNPTYGTDSDAEYVVLARGRRRAILFLLSAFVYPLLGPLRFLFLSPIAVVSSAADRIIWSRMSSLYMMNPQYRRRDDPQTHSAARWMQELACCLWGWSLVWMVSTGRLSLPAVSKTYVLFLFWMGINQLRTMAAHRYQYAGTSLGHLEQLLDSNTFPKGLLLPSLWAPLGLRYHALHHLMPSLPYHRMGEAHRRLMQQLPVNSPYHRTCRRGMWSFLVDLV